MKKEFRHMLEVMPEAILISDPSSKELTFANTELHRLTEKYAKPQSIPLQPPDRNQQQQHQQQQFLSVVETEH